MNGIDVTCEIRKLSLRGKKVPIIAMTAHVLESDREKAYTAGMNDFITKPILQDQLVYLLNRWLPKTTKRLN